MARFLVWSDLHDEFWDQIPDIPDSVRDVDGVLLAGDSSTQGRHVDIAISIYDQIQRPVIMVRGNHEFYRSTISDIVRDDRKHISAANKSGRDIRMLDADCAVTEVSGTRIIGATLWTDLNLYPGHEILARKTVLQGMNDFQMIRVKPGRSFEIKDWIELHMRDRKAIFRALADPYKGSTVVMTHHMPVRTMIHPVREIGKTERHLLNAAFASDMSKQISKCEIDFWVSGHSHDNRSTEVMGKSTPVKVVSNARGYPGEKTEFDPGFIIQT